MFGLFKSSVLVCLFSFYLAGLVNGSPIVLFPATGVEHAARAAAATPTTVSTSRLVQTSTGPQMETCTITLTPDASGSYQEVKTCTLSPVSSSGANPAAPTTAAAGAATTNPAVAVNGHSSVASSAVFSATTTTPVAANPETTASEGTADGALNNVGSSNPTQINNDANPGATTSAASSAATKTAVAAAAAPFVIPGRHILIIPVGLVVYCTLTGITMILVILVTFERVMYRRAFRKRKLAEQGAAMGYGGIGKI
ncbi:uncharacterized protein FIBRA_07216 [Fibroporia radiculosa]|uniref:Uncharacterized protein n=1 Tax=Fibroporia radiculosa TaxID=599839 RepID=J4I0B9_9APHY|nr:uncharacterized protein FIBRA_07216 [Fibroporia radiculosa]CCM05017.1 predicted protein [Fibroporia radiculosa]